LRAVREVPAREYRGFDLRTWLKGPDLYFVAGDRKYSFAEFQTVVGDRSRRKPAYPYFWLLTPDLRAKELPRGTQLFKSVDEHRKALSAG
jgi:hypothetical protein